MMKSSVSKGFQNNAPKGDAGQGDKSLSWAGKHNIDGEVKRPVPTLSAPGPRAA